MSPRINILILTVLFTALDLITKHLAVENFRNIPFEINSFTRLTYAENTGIAFSIPVPPLLLVFLTIGLILFVIYFIEKELNLSKKLAQFASALILGGAIGNLIERIGRGYVIDFISIGSWPTFNFADIYITLGVLLVLAFYGKIKGVKNTKNA